ncbi:MFS transporter [Acuticoccus sp. M5D2P5]|uniref:MFS transporter n=1 Tax=Acuticoccus kalidii TaxID=2910977 RepID=UPI001F33A201|nr:MFS transporter [Acuticoccus kalidii]MCF3933483.1 MFS transporter [Acuticoccus kalidii]
MNFGQSSQNLNNVKSLQTVALFGAVVLVGANAFVLTPILSEVAEGLGTAPYRVAWAISAFGAATAVSSLLLAPYIDLIGPRITLGSAAALLAFAQMLSVFSLSEFWLAGAQAVAGVAVGILLPGTYATTAATAEPGRQAARLGIVLTGWALSLVLAVPVAAFITASLGWRSVYGLTGAASALVAIGLFAVMPGAIAAPERTSSLRVLRLPGVASLLVILFGFMTAFYGTFAYFGEGIRNALDLSAEGAGLFVFVYGIGFGVAGLVLGRLAPRITPAYILVVMGAIAAIYFAWRLALDSIPAAVLATLAWGFLNQFGLNSLIVTLNRQVTRGHGAVMGLNSAVTYTAVFTGPLFLGPVFTNYGFAAVATCAGAIVALGAAAVAMSRR